MKNIIKFLVFVCFVLFYDYGFSQCPCDDFKVIELRDTIFSGQPSFTFKLTADSSRCSGGYSDFWFIDQVGDTLNQYTGSGIWLPDPLNPIFDTMEYRISLNPGYSNFPIDFSGNLQICAPSCTVPFTYLNLTTTKIIELESLIKIFPNPSNNVIQISNKSEVVITSIEIYNAKGSHIAFEINNNKIVNINELVSGVYYVKLYSKDSVVAIKKLVKN